MSELRPERRGTALALDGSAQYAGMMLATSIAAALLQSSFSFTTIGILCGVCALAALPLLVGVRVTAPQKAPVRPAPGRRPPPERPRRTGDGSGEDPLREVRRPVERRGRLRGPTGDHRRRVHGAQCRTRPPPGLPRLEPDHHPGRSARPGPRRAWAPARRAVSDRPRPHPGRRPCGRRPHRHRNVRRRSPRRDRRTRPSVERIETDTEPESAGAEQWRADHPTDYERALPWLRREAQVVDTTGVLPAGVATTVLRGARSG